MKKLKLKHHPQLILLWVAHNYMNELEFKNLLNSLPMRNSDSIFMRNFRAHFDIERIRKK